MKNSIFVLLLMASASFSFAQVPNYVPSNGLVGWWPFNGNANDESGNGNNGAVNGATLTSDRFGNGGKAYSFDGVDDVISIDSSVIQYATSATVSFWFQTNDFSTRSKNIFNKKRAFNGDGLNFTLRNDSCFALINRSPTGPTQYFTPASQITSIWNHGVVVLNNGFLTFYINGIQEGSITTPQGALLGNQRLYIGKGFDVTPDLGGVRAFDGIIDDFGIWNRALTQQEINDLYNGGICYQNITVTDTLLINTNITGFNPVTYENTIRIWPNPTNDHITIDAGDLNVMNGYSIRITNSLGQQMFQSAINQQQFYLDLSTWSGNGMYFVNIIDPSGNIIDVKKIVLQ